MYSRILILRFRPTKVQKPLVCDLARKFDLTFNILNATILPRKEGILVLELSGSRKDFKDGVSYLRDEGVQVANASQDIKRDVRKCVHCGACTAVCPTGALYIERPEMSVTFEHQKCSVCQMCVTACPTRAMETRPNYQTFF